MRGKGSELWGAACGAKTAAIVVIASELVPRSKISIACSGDAVKELHARPKSRVRGGCSDKVASTLDELSCPEGAELDSLGQRPGMKAEATQHKAQRAVTP